MALIPCPACNKEVSDSAPSCPSCGEPIKKAMTDAATGNVPLRKGGKGMAKLIVAGVLVVLVLVVGYVGYHFAVLQPEYERGRDITDKFVVESGARLKVCDKFRLDLADIKEVKMNKQADGNYSGYAEERTGKKYRVTAVKSGGNYTYTVE